MTLTTSLYGATQTNPIAEGYHDGVDHSRTVTLREVAEHGGRITRVRLLTESWNGQRLADVSYIHVTWPNGVISPVQCDVPNLTPLWGPKGIKAAFVAWARSQGANAKALGLLDEGVWSVLKG